MRLRQVVIASAAMESVASEFEKVLGVEECHRDPAISAFGLENIMMVVGDTFLEVLTPIKPDTAAGRYLERHGGDAGYMICVQVDNLPHARGRVERLGLRIVSETNRSTLKGFHIHPKDIGGAIVALNVAIPPGSWEGAGEWHEWREHVRTDVSTEIVGVEFGAEDPKSLVARWSDVLERPFSETEGRFVIELDRGYCRFVQEDGESRQGITGFDVAVASPGEVAARASARGLVAGEGWFDVAGVRVHLVSR